MMKDSLRIIAISQPARITIDERHAMTTDAWSCSWMRRDVLRTLYMPMNYVWDGASIPRVAWSMLGLAPFGLLDAPSLAHDALYRSKGGRGKMGGCKLVNGNGNKITVSREEADWLFYLAMKYFHVTGLRDEFAYGAVRAFGWKFWGEDPPGR